MNNNEAQGADNDRSRQPTELEKNNSAQECHLDQSNIAPVKRDAHSFYDMQQIPAEVRKTDNSNIFQTASGIPLKISEAGKAKAFALFAGLENDFDEQQQQEQGAHSLKKNSDEPAPTNHKHLNIFEGLTSAQPNSISTSKLTGENQPQPRDNKPTSCITTLPTTCFNPIEQSESTDLPVNPNIHQNMFQTALGKTVVISDESKAKAAALLASIEPLHGEFTENMAHSNIANSIATQPQNQQAEGSQLISEDAAIQNPKGKVREESQYQSQAHPVVQVKDVSKDTFEPVVQNKEIRSDSRRPEKLDGIRASAGLHLSTTSGLLSIYLILPGVRHQECIKWAGSKESAHSGLFEDRAPKRDVPTEMLLKAGKAIANTSHMWNDL